MGISIGALGRHTDEDDKSNRMQEDSSDDESSDVEVVLKGNESYVPSLVDIRKENGEPALITQV